MIFLGYNVTFQYMPPVLSEVQNDDITLAKDPLGMRA
jgi:hypothetical protein